jgi:hypothetical protein
MADVARASASAVCQTNGRKPCREATCDNERPAASGARRRSSSTVSIGSGQESSIPTRRNSAVRNAKSNRTLWPTRILPFNAWQRAGASAAKSGASRYASAGADAWRGQVFTSVARTDSLTPSASSRTAQMSTTLSRLADTPVVSTSTTANPGRSVLMAVQGTAGVRRALLVLAEEACCQAWLLVWLPAADRRNSRARPDGPLKGPATR